MSMEKKGLVVFNATNLMEGQWRDMMDMDMISENQGFLDALGVILYLRLGLVTWSLRLSSIWWRSNSRIGPPVIFVGL